jgi:hypothetical protein
MSAESKKRTVTFLRPNDPPSSKLPRTFVDRYSEWASTITDAPVQYHRATGVTILSTIMTPHLSFPTSFGTFIPNLWMMVLAGTTMTRKSTSLDIARRLLDDVTDDYMLATDGSPEGLLTELGYRDEKVSVFHRDEITGFMSAVSGRDYLSGLLESFTRLYDGQPETRILRREKIEIKKPYLIFMAGGIKTRMEELVGMEHIRSGFLPRFIFVSGSTTRDQVRPIGPPDERDLLHSDDSPRDAILNELWQINEHYTRPDDSQPTNNVIKIAGIVKSAGTPAKKHVKLKGSPEFWARLVELQEDAMEMGETSSAPELYTPLYQRLANSILKVAMLLAGADYCTTIELCHLQKAISLAQEWVEAVTDFASAIEQAPEMDKWEKKLDKIIQWVKTSDPRKITQTEVMQKFRMRKRDMADIEDTLMARGAVQVTPYPHPPKAPGSSILYTVPDRMHSLNGRPLTKIEREDTYHAESDRHSKGRSKGRRIPFPVSTDD